MKNLVLRLSGSILMGLIISVSTYATSSACTTHTDEEYNEMIIGTWSNISPYDNNKKDFKATSTYSKNGSYRIELIFRSSPGIIEYVIGTWSIKDGRIIHRATQSNMPYMYYGECAETIICMGSNTFKSQDNVDLYRVN